ncbi:Phosphatidylinositol transfer protein sfh5 [Metarhizium anisopliae]|nr:Phosphatidylinositol transfer protein sfh5 [Metarhizium anisopliae]
MWGVDLSTDSAHAPTQVVLYKFLKANNNDVAAAEKQLTSALEWRKKIQAGKLVTEPFDESKFGDLGFVTVHKDANGEKETVITWNIYGAVKDKKATFGNVDDFIRWRVALMELGVQKLRLNEIKEPLALDAPDSHQMLQVHDYLSVSFLRMDPDVKAATKKTIETFSMAYPELLAHKYFVNVPAIMGWMYAAMKLFLPTATLRKFHPMASGTTLAAELPDISASLPKEYGGQGPSVKEGETVKLVDLTPKAEETKVDAAPAVAGAEVPAAGSEPKPDVTPAADVAPKVIDEAAEKETAA